MSTRKLLLCVVLSVGVLLADAVRGCNTTVTVRSGETVALRHCPAVIDVLVIAGYADLSVLIENSTVANWTYSDNGTTGTTLTNVSVVFRDCVILDGLRRLDANDGRGATVTASGLVNVSVRFEGCRIFVTDGSNSARNSVRTVVAFIFEAKATLHNVSVLFDRCNIVMDQNTVGTEGSMHVARLTFPVDDNATTVAALISMVMTDSIITMSSNGLAAPSTADATVFNIYVKPSAAPLVVISDLHFVVRRCSLALEATQTNAMLNVKRIVLRRAVFEAADVNASFKSVGDIVGELGFTRDNHLIDLSTAPSVEGSVVVVDSTLRVTSPLCDGSPRVSASRCRSVMAGIVFIAPRGNTTIVVERCALEFVLTHGMFSFFMGQVGSFLVQLDAKPLSASGVTAVIRNCTSTTHMIQMCPYRRTVSLANMGAITDLRIQLSTGTFSFSVTLLLVFSPADGINVLVKGSGVSVLGDISVCAVNDTLVVPTSSLIPLPNITSSVLLAVAVTAVMMVDVDAANNDNMHSFLDNPMLIAYMVETAGKTMGLSPIMSTVNVTVSTTKLRSESSSSAMTAFDMRGEIGILGVQLRNATVSVAGVSNAFVPPIVVASSTLTTCRLAVSGLPSFDSVLTTGGVMNVPTVMSVLNTSFEQSTVDVTRVVFAPFIKNVPWGPALALFSFTNSSFRSSTIVISSLSFPVAHYRLLFPSQVLFYNATIMARCVVLGSNEVSDANEVIENVALLSAPIIEVMPCSASPTKMPRELFAFNSVVSAASVAAILMADDLTSAGDLQLFGIMGMTMCASSGLRQASGPMVYLVSPFADLGSAWSAGGNVLVSVCFACVHLCAVRVVMWRRDLRRWVDGAAVVQFPGVSYSVCVLLVSGAVRFGLQLLADAAVGTGGGSSGGAVVLGVVSVAWAVFVPCAAAVCVWRRGGERVFRAYRVSVWRRRFGWPAVLAFPLGVWEPEAERRRVGRLVSLMRGGDELLGPYGVWVTVAASLVSVFRPSGNAGCCAQWAVLGALFGGVAVALVIRCPTRAPLVAHVSTVKFAVLFLMCVVSAIGSHISDSTVIAVAVACSFVLSIMNVIRMMHMLWLQYFESMLRANDKKQKKLNLLHVDRKQWSQPPGAALRSLVEIICTNSHSHICLTEDDA